MTVLSYFFGNFWHFIGLLIVLALIGQVVLGVAAILAARPGGTDSSSEHK